jgi:hypothetical protein
MFVIYSLSCPIDKSVKYIGLTSDPLEKRLEGHLKTPTNGANYNWFSLLSKENKKPIIEYIDSCSNNKREGLELEKYWISQFKAWGFELNNNKRIPIENDLILRVKKLLEEKGMFHHFIAKKIKVNPMDLCHALNGKRSTPTYIEILYKAEKFLLTLK